MILSIVLIVTLGMLAGIFFDKIGLPGLLGMIIVGVIIGPYGLDILAPAILENAGEIRLMALVIILLRAGLGLEKELLRRVGGTAIKMSAIPCLLEGFTIMAVAHVLLDLPVAEAGMLGFIVAATTPAVIVPAMLQLMAEGRGMQRGVPVIVLAGASVDDVFAITLFTVFMGLAQPAGQPLLGQIARIPVQIVGGIVLGGLGGWGLAALFRRRELAHLEQVGLTLAGALAVLLSGEAVHVAGLLGVMTLGLVLQEKAPTPAARVEKTLGQAWFFAQIFLFVLIGAEVNLGVAWQAGLSGIVIIVAGLLARALGVWLSLIGSDLTAKERLFAILAYLPKATVQAAIGGIPLALGFASGGLILAIAVLAVIMTASVGAVAIKATAPRLLEQEA
ncbi:MAG: cation:proton antiporter [Anaerolineae bacterium]|nr:cation:proton antiporter [Anaerolineae bacterium]